MPEAYLLGFSGLALGFFALLIGIVLFAADKEELIKVPWFPGRYTLAPVIVVFQLLASWRWRRAYVLILVGIGAIVTGVAAVLFA